MARSLMQSILPFYCRCRRRGTIPHHPAGFGFFGRSKRYTLVAEDGVVTQLNIDENPGVCELSAGETVLEQL